MRREHVTIFKALGDPTRLRIMKMLQQREICLCEAREILGRSSSTVSKHLTILRDAGLVIDSKEGKWVNFRLNEQSNVRIVRSLLTLIRNSYNDDDMVRDDARRLSLVDRSVICGTNPRTKNHRGTSKN